MKRVRIASEFRGNCNAIVERERRIDSRGVNVGGYTAGSNNEEVSSK